MASILRTKSAYDIQFSGCDGRAAGAVQDLRSNLAVWQRRALQFSSLRGESNRGNCRCRCRVDSARHRCRRRFRFSQRGTVAQIPLLHATSIIVLSGARRGRRRMSTRSRGHSARAMPASRAQRLVASQGSGGGGG